VNQIKDLKERFLSEILPREMVPPKLKVPELGQHKHPVADFAGVTAQLVTENRITQSQHLVHVTREARSSYHRGAKGIGEVQSRLDFYRKTIGLEIDIPADHKMVLVSSNGERVLQPPKAVLPGDPGAYVLELYDSQGEKVGDQSFTLPDANVHKGLSSNHFGKDLVDENDQPLERQLTSYTNEPLRRQRHNALHGATGTEHSAKWSFVPEGTAQHSGDVAAATKRFNLPDSNLRDGRYTATLTQGARDMPKEVNVELRKFPGDRYQLVYDGKEHWLTPGGGERLRDPMEARRTGVLVKDRYDSRFFFEPKTNQLSLFRIAGDRRGIPYQAITLNESHFAESPDD
jgi:hypothetical protein